MQAWPPRTFVRTMLCAGLLAMASLANAEIQNRATYSVTLQAVQTPGTPAQFMPGATDTRQSVSRAPDFPPLVPVQVGGSADTGPNHNGFGYANGIGFARASAGVLAASAVAEGQAVAQPGTNVGASASVRAVATFADLVTFSPIGQAPNSLVIISGNLLLSGNMYKLGGGFGEVKVGGTGLNQNSAFAEWSGDSNGVQKSATGVYSTWVPGSAVAIPFSFAAFAGQPLEISYWLDVHGLAGASFPDCPALGGLCSVVQVANSVINMDYSHTLAWGGVSVTSLSGVPRAFTVTSASGFDYSTAYLQPVPEPETWALLLSGLLLVGALGRRRTFRTRALQPC